DRGVEVAGQAVVALGHRPLIIPPQAEVEGQLFGDAPVVLEVESREALRVERCGVAREIASGGQTEQERGEGGAIAGAAADGGLLACPVAVEIELALIADPSASLLQDPVFAAVANCMVAVDVSKNGGPGVVGIEGVAARVVRAEIAGKAGDPWE